MLDKLPLNTRWSRGVPQIASMPDRRQSYPPHEATFRFFHHHLFHLLRLRQCGGARLRQGAHELLDVDARFFAERAGPARNEARHGEIPCVRPLLSPLAKSIRFGWC